MGVETRLHKGHLHLKHTRQMNTWDKANAMDILTVKENGDNVHTFFPQTGITRTLHNPYPICFKNNLKRGHQNSQDITGIPIE